MNFNLHVKNSTLRCWFNILPISSLILAFNWVWLTLSDLMVSKFLKQKLVFSDDFTGKVVDFEIKIVLEPCRINILISKETEFVSNSDQF